MGSVIFIPIIFSSATLLLYFLSTHLPELSHQEYSVLKLPSSIEDITNLSQMLLSYKARHVNYVLLLFALAYLWKQTFAIPGSVFMNILAGALFGLTIGFPMACLLSACGASCCYLLSNHFGKQQVMKFFPHKITKFQNAVEDNKDSLFFFLLFLRLFPMSPNWFMNMVAPILNVPLHLFFLSVLIGLMPYNFICVQTGCVLSEVRSLEDVFNIYTSLKLVGVALVALVPGLLLKRYHKNRNKLP